MTERIGTASAVIAGALLALTPSGAGAAPASDGDASPPQHGSASYTPGNKGDQLNKQLQTQLDRALKAPKSAANRAAATTVYFSVEDAPTYAAVVRQGAKIWNESVSNVKLVENPGSATLDYREGNDSRGSYAYSDGRGNGHVFFDYAQMGRYNQLRVATHETGHTLGLPDNYSGPCSELMSGGGPGTSCTNPYPNASEISKINSIWGGGYVGSPAKTANPSVSTLPASKPALSVG